MGLKDRLLDLVASLFAPAMDHPAGGGMTGNEGKTDDTDPSEDEASERAEGRDGS